MGKLKISHNYEINIIKQNDFIFLNYGKDYLKVDTNNGGVRVSINNFVTKNDFFNVSKFIEKIFINGISNLNSKITHDCLIRLKIESTICEFVGLLGIDKIDYKISEFTYKTFVYDLMDWFVDKKKIKVPNYYHYLLLDFNINEKFLSKNDRKLVMSILDEMGIKSKITNKIFHTCERCDLRTLYVVCRILGDDYNKYLGNMKPSIFLKVDRNNINNIQHTDLFSLTNYERESLGLLLTKINKSCVCLLSDFNDHIKMLRKLQPFFPNLRINAKDEKSFQEEHTDFSNKLLYLRKGDSIFYVFREDTITKIETPIEVKLTNDILLTFYPFLFKREEDFIEEGNFMHHCVSEYYVKTSTIIVSIRNEDGTNRITCEISKQNGRTIQSRHFTNQNPPDEMKLALYDLEKKTKELARLGLLNSIETKKVPRLINGIEIKRELIRVQLNEKLF